MRFKSALALLLIVTISSSVSWYMTSYYYGNQNLSSSEDIISREVSILEQAKNIKPTCIDLQKPNDISITKNSDFIIIWKLDNETSLLEKLVVNNEFYTAYEKVNKTCQ